MYSTRGYRSSYGPKKWPAHISVSHWIFKKNSTGSEDDRVPATANVRQVAGHSASSCYGASNIAGYTTAGTGSDYTMGANNASSNVETHQSTPSGAELLPTGDNVDMDDTIITDNTDQ